MLHRTPLLVGLLLCALLLVMLNYVKEGVNPTTITKGLPSNIAKLVINSKGETVVFYTSGKQQRYPPGQKPSFMKDKRTITTGLPSNIAKAIVRWNDDITEISKSGAQKTYKKPSKPSYMMVPPTPVVSKLVQTTFAPMSPTFSTTPAPTLRPIIGKARYVMAPNLVNASPEMRQKIVEALDAALLTYNRYAAFDKEFIVDYNPAVGTAEVGGDGIMRFGNMFGYRVSLHELSHMFGVGTRREWWELAKTGKWTGPRANALMQKMTPPGGDATIYCDGMHFWPGGLNQEDEIRLHDDADARHVLLVKALVQDMDALSKR